MLSKPFGVVFFVVSLAAVAVLCAGEYFVVNVKPYPCDYELKISYTGAGGEVRFTTEKYHGRFCITSDENSLTVERPDLNRTPGTVLSVDAEEDNECNADDYEPEARPTVMVFTHKEPDTLGIKECFKYYNETEQPFWFDAEGNLLGKEYPEEEEGSKTNEHYEEVEPFSRDTFVLPERYACAASPKVFLPPSEEAYAAECPSAPTSSSAPAPTPSSTSGSGSTPVSTSTSSSSAVPSSSTSAGVANALFPIVAIAAVFATLFL